MNFIDSNGDEHSLSILDRAVIRPISCGHLKGSCPQCHQCLIDAGSKSCPTCEGAAQRECLRIPCVWPKCSCDLKRPS